MSFRGFIVFVLAAVAIGSPSPRALVVHDSRSAPPPGFANQGSANDDTLLNLRIALAPKDIAGLEKTLYEVSTPSSAKYGQYLSLNEVKAYAAPKEETLSAVTAWLKEQNIIAKPSGAYNDWLTISIPVSKANDLLNAKFETFENVNTLKKSIRTLSYSIPKELVGHIKLIHPTTSFATALNPKEPAFTPITTAKRAVPASCASSITPACLQALYEIPTTPATQSSNQLGVMGFIDQFASQSDLTTFLSLLRTDVSSSTSFQLETLDGGQNPQGSGTAGIEADLDIQYTVGLATNVTITFISVGDDNNDEVAGFLDSFQQITDQDAPPQVISTSYGFNEQDLGADLATEMCNAYMALSARGVSLLFASGDGGVAGIQTTGCSARFVPTFPSTCPFVTSVGGTIGIFPEVTARFSGGGFSDVFPVPDYQADVVSAYISSIGSTNAGKFNTSGRGFPDIAAQAQNLEIVWQTSTGTVSGTSCSTPIFSSIISLVNDRLVAAGKPVLGFLNPFIYANPNIWTDVTSGNNPGCGTNGFSAATGWDPNTGLGTPIFDNILAAAGL